MSYLDFVLSNLVISIYPNSMPKNKKAQESNKFGQILLKSVAELSLIGIWSYNICPEVIRY